MPRLIRNNSLRDVRIPVQRLVSNSLRRGVAISLGRRLGDVLVRVLHVCVYSLISDSYTELPS